MRRIPCETSVPSSSWLSNGFERTLSYYLIGTPFYNGISDIKGLGVLLFKNKAIDQDVLQARGISNTMEIFSADHASHVPECLLSNEGVDLAFKCEDTTMYIKARQPSHPPQIFQDLALLR